LARCYLNRPELTADRFIPDPFTRQAGARIYKTGDLARFLPDGNIDYVGRIDQQVKLRGYRIEVQEIEQILLQHPDVREVIVLAHTGSELDSRLIAYVVGGGEAATINKLRINARDQLPE
jgi:acyl-coenzyme A synthetase/AMP-(fatty) acid ligase